MLSTDRTSPTDVAIPPATKNAHHQSEIAVRFMSRHDPAIGSTSCSFDILSISLMTSLGITRFANGMNQPPTAQPDDHAWPPAPREEAALYEMLLQMIMRTAATSPERNPRRFMLSPAMARSVGQYLLVGRSAG